jgi:hypothetical protein
MPTAAAINATATPAGHTCTSMPGSRAQDEMNTFGGPPKYQYWSIGTARKL